MLTVPDDGRDEVESHQPSRGTALGRFLVLGPLGAGGMGLVLAAYDPELDRKVAIKLVRPERWDERERARLIKEAQTMARLAHPNIVAVHEVGSAGGQHFIVMEFVDGRTLRQVLAEERLDVAAILRLVCAAGDGLAAAHRAGVIHRDFKPDNVLVCGDGRPRVTDFGLAAGGTGGDRGDVAGSTVSRLAGTPGYMAPEQVCGDATDARTDQYAFCVTLHEALYGERPVAGTVRDGAAPAHVRDVIRRGLSPDPSARWPSMDALLAHLRRDPRARRRRIAAAGMAIAAVAFGAFLVGRSGLASPTPSATCDGGAQIAGVWDKADRERVRTAFLAVGAPYAAGTFDRVDRSLQARQRRWALAHRDACEATRVRGEQSETLLDLRMQCLARARGEIAALIEAFGRADQETVERAAQAAAIAGDIDVCADTAALAAPVPPPSDPDRRRRIDVVQARVAQLKAWRETGRLADGLRADDDVIAAARENSWAPLLGEALYEAGLLAFDDDVAVAEARLREALQVAAGGRADALAANVVRELVRLLAFDRQQVASAELLLPMAWAALRRAGEPRALRARLLGLEADLLAERDQYQESLARAREALMLDEAEYGVDSAGTIRALQTVANVLTAMSRPGDARSFHERAVRAAEMGLGPEHPATASAWSRFGIALIDLGEIDAAAAYQERALVLYERLFGPDHADVADVAQQLAIVRMDQRRFEESRQLLERALAIREQKLGPKHPRFAVNLRILASLARREGKLDEAQQRLDRALAIQIEVHGPDDMRVSDTHLALGAVLHEMERYPEAAIQYQRALAIRTRALGADNARVADVLSGLGQLELDRGRPAAAREYLKRAVPMFAKDFGDDNRDLVDLLTPLAKACVGVGDGAGAVVAAERATAIVAAHRLPADTDGWVRFALATALWTRNASGDRARALALARDARALLPASEQGLLSDIDRWLAARRRAR